MKLSEKYRETYQLLRMTHPSIAKMMTIFDTQTAMERPLGLNGAVSNWMVRKNSPNNVSETLAKVWLEENIGDQADERRNVVFDVPVGATVSDIPTAEMPAQCDLPLPAKNLHDPFARPVAAAQEHSEATLVVWVPTERVSRVINLLEMLGLDLLEM